MLYGKNDLYVDTTAGSRIHHAANLIFQIQGRAGISAVIYNAGYGAMGQDRNRSGGTDRFDIDTDPENNIDRCDHGTGPDGRSDILSPHQTGNLFWW